MSLPIRIPHTDHDGSPARWVGAFALALVVTGCLGRPLGSDENTDTSGASSTTGADPLPGTSAEPTTSGSPPPSDSSSGVTDGEESGFDPIPDGLDTFECDPFEQNCPEGYKCTAWSNDGGPVWNATHCAPIVRDPAQHGEPCSVERPWKAGVDDCDFGLVCWPVDENLEGTCLHLCTGDVERPTCPNASDTCVVSDGFALAVCHPQCDPLAQDCPMPDDACLPVGDGWVCAFDASGESGAHGDGCEFINACDPGLACVSPDAFEDCTSAGCCSTLCNVEDPGADAMCAALDPAQSCEPWHEPGKAPRGYAHVGFCTVSP